MRMVFGLVTSVWLARYLGPAQFGTYSLVLGTVAMASSLVPLATDQILQRELLASPQDEGTILKTALVMRLVGGVIAAASALVTIGLLRPDQPTIGLIAVMAGGSLIFYPAEVLTVWFMSHLGMRNVFLSKVPPLVMVFTLRIALILMGAPLFAFIGVAALEAVLCALCLVIVFTKRGARFDSSDFSWGRGGAIWRDSWPLLLAGIGTALYLKIDIVMLGAISGDQELGIYGAATRLSEVWYAVPTIVGFSLQPLLFTLRTQQPERYDHLKTALYGAMAWSGIGVGVATWFVAIPLCVLLFGPQYGASGSVLAIHIWAVVPMFLMVTSQCFLIAERQGAIALVRTAVGLTINVLLNLVLIAPFGARGAAIATVVSYGCALFAVVAMTGSRSHAFAFLRAVSFTGLRDALAFSIQVGHGLGYGRPKSQLPH